MKVSDIQIGDILQSNLYEHRVRVLSLPRIVEGCWVIGAIHFKGAYEGLVVDVYHVSENGNGNGSNMIYITSNSFSPIRSVVKLNMCTLHS